MAAVGSAAVSQEPDAEALFQRHCTVCHGAFGAGDGPQGLELRTPPADLTDGRVKLRSTPPGEAPLLADLERTIAEGVRGTGMVEWSSQLADLEIAALARHVLELEGFEEPGEPASEVSPAGAAAAALDSVEPAAMYEKLGCAKCHGEDLRGEGPSAAGLVDSKSRPMAVPDLTLLPYKRGSDPEETAKSLLYGLEGTPMPAYGAALSREQALALARWLHAQARERRGRWIGEEHLGAMIEMHGGGRHMMGPMGRGMGRGMGPRRGRGGG